MTRYKNKYRIESARCSNWDYTSDGYYFVTICTHNRQCFFGDVIAGKMQLSDIGLIIAQEWQKTTQIRSNVQLGKNLYTYQFSQFEGFCVLELK